MIRNGLAVIIMFVMGAIAIVIAQGQGWMVDRDFFTYWGGGRGLLDEVNLYAPTAWSEIHRFYGSAWLENPIFIYAPPTAIFFAPLAALRIDFAGVAWIFISEIFVALSVVMLVQNTRWSRLKLYVPFWAVGIVLFMPVLLTLLMGQASALLLIIVVTASALWDRGRWFTGGMILGLTIVKPQPVVFLIPMVGFWLLLNKRWSALLGIALSIGVSMLAGFALFPNFIQDWQAVAFSKVGGVATRMPTVWGLSADLFDASPLGTWIAVALTALAVGAGVAIVTRWKSESAVRVVAALVPLSLLTTPYLWNYDQILLLMPLFIVLIGLEKRNVSFWVIALAPLALDLVAIAFFGIAAVRLRDTLSALLPMGVGAMVWTSRLR